jgi:hypothetical protein
MPTQLVLGAIAVRANTVTQPFHFRNEGFTIEGIKVFVHIVVLLQVSGRSRLDRFLAAHTTFLHPSRDTAKRSACICRWLRTIVAFCRERRLYIRLRELNDGIVMATAAKPVTRLPSSRSGMSSIIEKKRPDEFMSFRHEAEIKDGKVQPPPAWSGAHKDYTLTAKGGRTTLTVDLDAADEYRQMFEDKFPQALKRVKSLSEVA